MPVDIGPFTTHYIQIPARLGKPIQLVPFGDVHWYTTNCAVALFDEFCAWGKTQTDTYYVNMGDPIEFPSVTERRAILHADFHESTLENLELFWEEVSRKFVEKTSFMRGHLIGMIEGNHYAEFANGMTTTQFMVNEYNYVTKKGKKVAAPGPLKCKYLGIQTFIRIALMLPREGTRITVDIWAHHGRGQGQTKGGSLGPVENMARTADANIYIMGHNHDLGVWPDVKLKLETSGKKTVEVKDRPIRYVRSGSFLKGYVEGKRHYAVTRAYRPLALGWPVVQIIPHCKRYGERRAYEIELRGTV